MKIIELYGYSCSGKSFMAKDIKTSEIYDDSFLQISKKNRFLRLVNKLFYFIFLKFEDLNFVLNMHKEFNFLKLKYKLKNFFSFLYLIGFIRKNIKNHNPVIIDHGFLQCIFSCYIMNKNEKINHQKISEILEKYLFNFPINFDYKILCMNTNFNIIKSRLKKTKNVSNLKFLENNEEKIRVTYLHLKKISKFISNDFIDFIVI